MKISFDFDLNDWLAFQEVHLKQSKQFVKIMRIATWSLPITFISVALLGLSQHTLNMPMLLVLGVASMLWLNFYPNRFRKKTIKNLKKNLVKQDLSKILGKREYEFKNDEIHYLTPYSEGMMTWDSVLSFKETSTYYFIYESEYSAIIIPKVKLNLNMEQLDEFKSLIQAKTKKTP